MRRSRAFAIAGAIAITTLAAWSWAARAQESPAVASARAAGIVGERFDGYVGFAGRPVAGVRTQVEAINIRRRALYIDLARRRGVTAQDVGVTAGCQLLARVPAGGAYMLPDGVWRRRSGGESISPDYCRGG